MLDKEILPFLLLLLSYLQFCVQAETGQCGSYTEIKNRSSGVIYSHPGFDGKSEYKPKDKCRWKITGQTGKIVHLYIDSFSIGKCPDNYLRLEDSDPSRYVHICNGNKLRDFYSGGESLEVAFKTDRLTPATGFKLTYKLISKDTFFNTSWCGGPYRLGGNSGRIEQMFVGEEFECLWLIENKKSSVIRLRIWELPPNEELKLFLNEKGRTPSKLITRKDNYQDIYFSGEKLKIKLGSTDSLKGLLNISYEIILRSELASLQTRPRNLVNVENGSTVTLYCNPPMRTAVGRVNLTIGNGSMKFVKNPDNNTEVFNKDGKKLSDQKWYPISGTQRSGLAITFVATMKYEGVITCTVEKEKNKSDKLFPETMVMSKSVNLTVIVSPKIIKFLTEPESPEEGEMINATCIYSPGIPRKNMSGIGYLSEFSPNMTSKGNEIESATWQWVVHSSQHNTRIGCKIGNQENTSKVVIKSPWIYYVVYGIVAVLAIALIIVAIFVIRCLQRRTQSREKDVKMETMVVNPCETALLNAKHVPKTRQLSVNNKVEHDKNRRQANWKSVDPVDDVELHIYAEIDKSRDKKSTSNNQQELNNPDLHIYADLDAIREKKNAGRNIKKESEELVYAELDLPDVSAPVKRPDNEIIYMEIQRDPATQ